MPTLKWNEHEVVECLGVLAETDEFFCSHSFVRAWDSIRLELTIWQLESTVACSLFNGSAPSPFLALHFIVRDRIEFVNRPEFASLKFHDAVVVKSRFWLEHDESHHNWFDQELFPTEIGFELTAHPNFEFKVF